MQVALYARVSTSHQQQEGTIESQRRCLKHSIQHQGWDLLPEHEYLEDGLSGARLDRPALDRCRDAARRGEFDAVVVLSSDRLARNYAHQWLLVEEFEKLNTQWIFLQNPFGDTPQGKLLIQMQGMIAEYERAQITERTRRGRLEKARRGEFIPWAYRCYGYRYLPKRHGSPPQVIVGPTEAEVIRDIYRAAVEEQLTCRQVTKRLNASRTPTPSGHTPVWHPATVRNILTHRVYAGQARYNYRQPVLPQYRKKEASQLPHLKTGRSYRPETDWVWSEAPAQPRIGKLHRAEFLLGPGGDGRRWRRQTQHRRRALTEHLAPIGPQRQDVDGLLAVRASVGPILAAAPGRLTDASPIGRLVDGPSILPLIDEGLQQHWRRAIVCHPVRPHPRGGQRQHVRAEVCHGNARQDEKPAVGHQPAQVRPPGMGAPADPVVARGHLPGRGAERQRPQPADHRRADQIALLRAAQRPTAQRMVLHHHPPVQQRPLTPLYRHQPHRAEGLQRAAEHRCLERLEHRCRAGLRRCPPRLGQRDQSAPLQFHERLATADLLRSAVGAEPIQPLAHPPRQGAAREPRLADPRPARARRSRR